MLFRNAEVTHERQRQAVEMFYTKGAEETWQYNMNFRPNPVLEGRNAMKKYWIDGQHWNMNNRLKHCTTVSLSSW